MANGNGGWVAPKTETPGGVITRLVLMAVALGLALCFLFGSWWIIGIIATLAILGFSTEIYTEGVPQYYAIILMNNLTHDGKQRVVFQGVHFKYPWESAQLDGGSKDFIDLRTEISDVIEDETYPTKDGLVVGTYVFTMKIDIGGDASDNVLRWASYEPEAVLRILRALISRTFSDYCLEFETEKILSTSKIDINDAILGKVKDKLDDFEKKYGVKVETVLEDLDRDPKLQEARDIIAKAESYAEAKRKLMADDNMSAEVATQFLKTMNFPNVTESTWNVNVDAPDLKNAQNISIFATPPKPSDAKKGGK